MPTPTPILRAAMTLAAALVLAFTVPSPAHAATVAMSVSRTSAPPPVPVTFSGSAAGVPTGTPVTLQRRAGSGPWSAVKGGGSISSARTYSLTTYVAVGAYEYRVQVGSYAASAPTAVAGGYGRNIAVPAAGAPFTFSARLPLAQSRPVVAQVQAGSTWLTRGGSTSTSGLAAVRTALTSTAYMRLYAPATSSSPAWAGPRTVVTIGIDPVIKSILDATNSYRQKQGRPALKLHPSLNWVSGKWAYYMHQACVFKHNPSYTSGYPAGWTKAAENIAAGQDQLTVVTAWINSPGHRANILGDYTHIGIGYYPGPRCYQRYWVQNFAKY